MKKIVLLLVVGFLLTINCMAQESKTFYLKNGAVIKGKVIEEQPGVSYKVKTSDGNIFVFEANDISTIKSEEKSEKKSQTTGSISFFSTQEIDVSGMMFENDNTYACGISTVNGILLNKQLYFGVGAEYKYTGFGSVVPFFLDVRFNFSENTGTPFINLGMGGAINTIRTPLTIVKPNGHTYEQPIPYENGAFGRIALGYKIDISPKLLASFSFSYSFQTYATNVWLYENIYLKADGIMHYIGLRMGIGLQVPLKKKESKN